MLRVLNQLGHQLPGLKTAEPAAWIAMGVMVLLIAAVWMFLPTTPSSKLKAAIGSTCIWTGLCGLTLLDNLYAASFSGMRSSSREHLVSTVLPLYFLIGCCTVWGTYLLSRFRSSREAHA